MTIFASYRGLDRPYSTANSSEPFPDPWDDYSSLVMPETNIDALRWSEFIVMNTGPYRAAIDRLVSYFITDIDITGGTDEERDKYLSFCHDTLQLPAVLRVLGLDFLVYGNSFSSVIRPFRRLLSCRNCGAQHPLSVIAENRNFNFRWEDYQFVATCAGCGKRGAWERKDLRTSTDQLLIKRWNPYEIDLLHDIYTDQTAYIWKIPEWYRKKIRQGDLFELERAPWEVIQAVKHANNIRFNDGVIFHMKEQMLAGVLNRGWGISRVISNFRQAYYVQVLRRYNEAIALDYVIPFRVITPMPRSGGDAVSSDPLLGANMPSFMAHIHAMLRKRRRDPAAWHTLPYPVQYTALGGDAQQLAPKDLLESGLAELLDAVGVPMDLYKGTMGVQAAAVGLRLFEANHNYLPANLNSWLRWVSKQISEIMSWEKVVAKLVRITHADDITKQMARLQLGAGGQISQTTALRTLDLDFRDEERRKLDEQVYSAELQQEAQERMQHQGLMDQMGAQQPGMPGGLMDPAMAGGAPGAAGAAGPAGAAGAPAGGQADPNAPPDPMAQFNAQLATLGPNAQVTPQDMVAAATGLAQQVLSAPPSQQRQMYAAIKQRNPALHAQVRAQTEQIRQDAKRQGGQMVMQQQFGGA